MRCVIPHPWVLKSTIDSLLLNDTAVALPDRLTAVATAATAVAIAATAVM